MVWLTPSILMPQLPWMNNTAVNTIIAARQSLITHLLTSGQFVRTASSRRSSVREQNGVLQCGHVAVSEMFGAVHEYPHKQLYVQMSLRFSRSLNFTSSRLASQFLEFLSLFSRPYTDTEPVVE